jgi:hypothetical protein
VKPSPITAFLGGTGAIIIGVLIKFRILPFLQHDTVMSGGRPVPAGEFAEWMSRNFFIFGAILFAVAIIWATVKSRK